MKQIHVKECDSTQDILKEQLKPGTSDLLVSCDNQLKGRGRGENNWESLPGSLCFSFTVSPHPVQSFTAIELSVLLSKFFEGSILGLKWPNDICNKHEKKCCGILVQSFHGIMIAGIGINLFSDHPDFGGIYDSSFSFDKASWSKEISTFLKSNRYLDASSLRKDWEDRCGHLCKQVRITEGSEVIEGIFKGIGKYGEAVILTASGEKHLFNGTLRVLSSDH